MKTSMQYCLGFLDIMWTKKEFLSKELKRIFIGLILFVVFGFFFWSNFWGILYFLRNMYDLIAQSDITYIRYFIYSQDYSQEALASPESRASFKALTLSTFQGANVAQAIMGLLFWLMFRYCVFDSSIKYFKDNYSHITVSNVFLFCIFILMIFHQYSLYEEYWTLISNKNFYIPQGEELIPYVDAKVGRTIINFLRLQLLFLFIYHWLFLYLTLVWKMNPWIKIIVLLFVLSLLRGLNQNLSDIVFVIGTVGMLDYIAIVIKVWFSSWPSFNFLTDCNPEPPRGYMWQHDWSRGKLTWKLVPIPSDECPQITWYPHSRTAPGVPNVYNPYPAHLPIRIPSYSTFASVLSVPFPRVGNNLFSLGLFVQHKEYVTTRENPCFIPMMAFIDSLENYNKQKYSSLTKYLANEALKYEFDMTPEQREKAILLYEHHKCFDSLKAKNLREEELRLCVRNHIRNGK